ncbi:MAG: T9SS type A sorting domain-containing protein [Candidatus Symbiothrix sp.]|nr:T9SS type A sorting domain-containing protein [Candidatus Symbiothrix sp.]
MRRRLYFLVVCLGLLQFTSSYALEAVPVVSKGQMVNTGELRMSGIHLKATTPAHDETIDGNVIHFPENLNNGVLVNRYVGPTQRPDTMILLTDTMFFYTDSVTCGIFLQRENNSLSFDSVGIPTTHPVATAAVIKRFTSTGKYDATSFPFPIPLANIKTKHNLRVWYYDAYHRSQITVGDGGAANWVQVKSAYGPLKAGVGYLISIESIAGGDSLARFSAHPDSAWVALNDANDEDMILTDWRGPNDDLTADLTSYRNNHNRGWNFVGATHKTSLHAIGGTSKTWMTDTPKWSWNSTTGAIYYADYQSGTLSDPAYNQVLAADAGRIPFVPFFIQTSDTVSTPFNTTYHPEGTLRWRQGSTVSPAAYPYDDQDGFTALDATPTLSHGYLRYAQQTEEVGLTRLDLALSGSTETQKTHIFFRANSSAGAKAGEDAEHLMSNNGVRVWTVVNNVKLFSNVMPASAAENIPVGIIAPKADTYEFSIDVKEGSITQAILLDKTTDEETDLLIDNYSFSTSGALNTSDRFVLFINATPTAIALEKTQEIVAFVDDHSILNVRNLSEGDRIQVYDVAGRLIASGKAQSSIYTTRLYEKGVYIVNVSGARSKIIKVLNK